MQCHLLCKASLTTSRQSQPLCPLASHNTPVKLLLWHSRVYLQDCSSPCWIDCAPWRLELSYSLFDSQAQAWHHDIFNICLLAKPRENLQWQTKKCHPWLCLIVNQQVGWRQSGQQANQNLQVTKKKKKLQRVKTWAITKPKTRSYVRFKKIIYNSLWRKTFLKSDPGHTVGEWEQRSCSQAACWVPVPPMNSPWEPEVPLLRPPG